MKKRILMLLIALIMILGTATMSWANEEDIIYIIPVSGEITPAMATFFKNSLKEAEEKKAQAILIEISTLGGRVDSAFEIKRSMDESKVPIIVYVKDRALSAGALISISASRIIMAPGSHMGSAEPIPYSVKAVAAIRGEFEAAAERNGRNKSIAAAMVDKDIDIPDLSPAGSLLDITAVTAKEYGYAEAILEGRENVLDYLGFKDERVLVNNPDFIIKVAQLITRSNIASLILTIGIIAIIIEIFTKGFGIFGIIGIGALSLYFGANFIVGYSKWWPLMLFVIGIILLVVEAFIPGFGVFGISGISSMVIGIVFAAPDPIRGLRTLGITSILVIIATPILFYYIGRWGAMRRIVLSDTLTHRSESKQESKDTDLLGTKGVALTTLRPSGIVNIHGRKVDAISLGEFIEAGTWVRVVNSKGLSVVVARNGKEESQTHKEG